VSRIKPCPECGIPQRITKHNTWLPNGTILEDNNPEHRVVFIENDALRDTYLGVEKMLGVPIDNIITESQRRSTYESVDNALPGFLKPILRWTGTRPITRYLIDQAKLDGKGAVELVSFRRRKRKEDYIKLRIREPFSLPLFCGNFAGAMEAVDGREISITWEETAPHEYELTAHISTHDVELKERLKRRPARYKPGDTKLHRCEVCGVPAIMSRYAWRLDRGIIENKTTGRRMIIISTATQDAIMDELVKELGETIAQAVVDAQRKLIASGFFSREEIKEADDLRLEFAYRGLGNLVEIDFDHDHLFMRLENPCLNEMVAGLAQGLYEQASQRKSRLDWEIVENGDLVVNARSRE